MKKILLFIAVLANLSASAYKVEYIAPGDYWKAVVKNEYYREGQTSYIFLPGIGERVLPTNTAPLTGTKEATIKVFNWMVSGAGNLPAIADRDTFNIVTVAPRWEYESGEIQAAISYARNILKASKIIIISNSLGQFGFSTQCDRYPDLPKSVDGLIAFVSGPGERTNTAKNIADAKLPCWFFTAEADTVSGTTPKATINLHKNIIAKGGVSWLTVLKAGQHSKPAYSHQIISQIVPATALAIGTKYLTTNSPLGFSGIVINTITAPAKNIFQWASGVNRAATLSPNVLAPVPASVPKNDTVRIHDTVIVRDTLPPIIIRDTLPPVLIRDTLPPIIIRDTLPPTIIRDTVFRYTASDPSKNGILRAVANAGTVKFNWFGERYTTNSVQIWWRDGTSTIHSAPAGMRCSGIVIDPVPGGYKYVLDIRNEKNEKQQKIEIGPYK